MQIQVTDNSATLNHKFAAFIGGQLPYAMARTLTQLGYEVRDEERDGLSRYFKLRTRWSRNSIKVIRAEKNDYPAQKCIVGIRDKVLALNITGGKRYSVKGGNIAIPTKEGRSMLNPGVETLGPTKFPSRVVKAKKRYGSDGARPFLMRTRSGANVIAVRESKKRLPITVLYKFKTSANVDKKWPFVENTRRIVAREYQSKLVDNISKALKSSR